MKHSIDKFGGIIYASEQGLMKLTVPLEPHAWPIEITMRENSFMRIIHGVPVARAAVTRSRKRRMRLAHRRK